MSLKILFIGDIVGKLGRKGVTEIVPQIKKEMGYDLVIANIENLAHGKGITNETFESIAKAGIDVYTSGNHVWDKSEGVALLANEERKILRPANYPEGVPGKGFLTINVNGEKVLIINLIGRVFMKQDFDDPFAKFDHIKAVNADVNSVIVDFHAEATSEKQAFGWHVSGQASLVVGTHTHTPTADQRILENGTGYVSDAGMVGAYDSIIGFDRTEIIRGFLTQLPVKHTMMETGKIVFNSIEAEIHGMKCEKISRIDRVI